MWHIQITKVRLAQVKTLSKLNSKLLLVVIGLLALVYASHSCSGTQNIDYSTTTTFYLHFLQFGHRCRWVHICQGWGGAQAFQIFKGGGTVARVAREHLTKEYEDRQSLMYPPHIKKYEAILNGGLLVIKEPNIILFSLYSTVRLHKHLNQIFPRLTTLIPFPNLSFIFYT